MKSASLWLGVLLAAVVGTAAGAAPAPEPSALVSPTPYQVAQAAPPATLAGGLYYEVSTLTPFFQIKTDAITQSRSLARSVYGGTFDYAHWAVGSTFKLTVQYMGQYLHYFNFPSERIFTHRGGLHIMKQFGDFQWHVGGQALFKHPAFNVGVSNLDQLYYTVGTWPIGIGGFNLLNAGVSFDYFRGGAGCSSYYAPGIVIGYSPPLGNDDSLSAGFGYRLQYRFHTDCNTPAVLRHVFGFSFAPQISSFVPINLDAGVAAQQNEPVTLFFSVGVGIGQSFALQQTGSATVVDQVLYGTPRPGATAAMHAPVFNTRVEMLQHVMIPATAPNGHPAAPGITPTDMGSTTGRDVDFVFP